jgi:hypothetical protein
MYVIWVFVAMPFVSVVFSAFVIARDAKRRLPGHVVELAPSTSRPMRAATSVPDRSHGGAMQ